MGRRLTSEQQTACRLLREYFFARIDIVAACQSWVDRKSGETISRPRPVRGENALDDLIAFHVVGPSGGKAPPLNYINRRTSGQVADGRGFHRLGSYSVAPDDTASWLCLDFDGPGADHSKGTTLADPLATMMVCYKRCRELGIPVHIEKSGSGAGWHLWVFFEEPVPAVDARLLGHFIAPANQPLVTGEIADVRNNRGIECFPKQNKVSSTKHSAGNLVWLPFWFDAKDGGNRFYVVGDDGELAPQDPQEFERFSVADLAAIIDQVPDDLRNVVLKKRPKRQERNSEPRTPSSSSSDYPATDSDLVIAALDSISPDCSYDDWVRIGMALHEWEPQAGLSIWNSWSARGDKYVAGEPEDKWESFSSGGGVTLGTLFDMAKKAGWEPPRHDHRPLPTDEEIAEFMDIDPAELIDRAKTDKQREVLDCLIKAECPLSPADVAAQTAKSVNAAQKLLSKMAQDGLIERRNHGTYEAVLPIQPSVRAESEAECTAESVKTPSETAESKAESSNQPSKKAECEAESPKPPSNSASFSRKPPSNRLPTIIVNNRQLRHVIDEAWGAVRGSNYPPRVFQRTGELVRLVNQIAGTPRIVQMNPTAMFGHLGKIANWVVDSNDVQRSVNPPKDVAAVMVEYPHGELPHIEDVVLTPVFAGDGALVQAPGYHRDARLWMHYPEGTSPIDIPLKPTPRQIDAARELLLDDLLVDFPFANESDRAHAIAALLLPFVRRMIDGPTPLHLIESPSPGTGKSLLAKAISKITLAKKDAESIPLAKDEGENAKKITAILSHTPQIILLDNVPVGIRSAALASVLTSTEWCDRILGSTRMITLPNRALWLATANNPALTLEIARRCVRIRIDSHHDRPWLLANFKHTPLEDWIEKHRIELMTAILTIIRGWIVAGQKSEKISFGSFDAWARVVGGILNFAQIPGFLGHLEELYEAADAEGNEWREFTAAWWDRFGPRYVTAAELLGLATDKGLLNATIGDKSLQSQKIRLGRALSAMRDRQFDVYRITTQRNSRTKNQTYGLIDVSDEDPKTPAPIVDLFSDRPKSAVSANQPTADSPQENLQQNQDSAVSAVSTVSNSRSTHTRTHTHAHADELANSPQPTHSPQNESADLADFDPQEEES